jgi:hypothetical protein
MNAIAEKPASNERETDAFSGWLIVSLNLLLLFGSIGWFLWLVLRTPNPDLLLIAPILTGLLAFFLFKGYFTLQPNEARVLILFGAYKGTVRQSGFWWANPFYSQTRNLGSSKISLRARNFNSEKLKVNDKRGNPIEIAAVIVWQVEDTAKAAFDVDDFASYVHIQSESAVRHIASLYAYDRGDEQEPTLRESADEIGGIAGAIDQGGRSRAGSAIDAPGLRAGDCPGHAASPAGRGGDRRANQDRAGRRQHGGNGVAGIDRKIRCET